MILIASMAEPDGYRSSGGGWSCKTRFEEITGHPALLMHYSKVNPEFVERYGFKAMFITGFGYGWGKVPPEATYGISDVLHNCSLPVLGACGGHQLIGWLFNHNVRKLKSFCDEPIRKLRPGEADYNPGYHPGYYTETGMQTVQILQRDPIFAGLRKKLVVTEAHYCEVKRVPPGFVHLARNENCEIQCIRHAERPLYGAQFHAENWTDCYADGKTFITNFFRIAGLLD
ncbi:gamma-glutamyl-gamma-aminobutyrate hydrolase family protein [bacterium]|nr:gamma-glutamyl-gamma-aminobutyrate hydrolase family protein [bacterium]